jgi:hypothetical protein
LPNLFDAVALAKGFVKVSVLQCPLPLVAKVFLTVSEPDSVRAAVAVLVVRFRLLFLLHIHHIARKLLVRRREKVWLGLLMVDLEAVKLVLRNRLIECAMHHIHAAFGGLPLLLHLIVLEVVAMVDVVGIALDVERVLIGAWLMQMHRLRTAAAGAAVRLTATTAAAIDL